MIKLLPHVWVGLRECFACGWSCSCVFLPLVLWPYWHSACWLVRHGSGVGVLWVLIRCPVCTLSFPRPPSHWHHFTTLATFATQSSSLSLSLLFSLEVFLNVYMIYTSLVSCLSTVSLSLFNIFILVNVYILYLLAFSFLVLFFFNSLKFLMFTFSLFLRVCSKSSELHYIGSYLIRQHTN